MTRDELVEIGKKIVAGEGGAAVQARLVKLFDDNVPHPDGTNLFFYPENYDARRDDVSQYHPTVEDVVDKCLAYQAIRLPPSDL